MFFLSEKNGEYQLYFLETSVAGGEFPASFL